MQKWSYIFIIYLLVYKAIEISINFTIWRRNEPLKGEEKGKKRHTGKDIGK